MIIELDKIKAKINKKFICKITAIFILVLLTIGLIETYIYIFFHVNPIKFIDLDIDTYWLRIFFIITFILLVQFILIKILGRVKKVAKLINSIVILNILTMLIAFAFYGVGKLIHSRFVIHLLDSFWFNFDAYVSMVVFWPAGMVWGRNNLISSTIFATLSIAIVTPMLYNILKRDTTSKKLLLTSIMTSSTICYTCITIFFHIKY